MSSVSLCWVCHCVKCVTMSSVSPCQVCHCVKCVAVSSVSLCWVCHCRVCRCVKCVTVLSVSWYQVCHYFKFVTLSSVSLCQVCHCVECVMVSSVSLFQVCHPVKCVMVSSVSLFQVCHPVKCVAVSSVSLATTYTHQCFSSTEQHAWFVRQWTFPCWGSSHQGEAAGVWRGWSGEKWACLFVEVWTIEESLPPTVSIRSGPHGLPSNIRIQCLPVHNTRSWGFQHLGFFRPKGLLSGPWELSCIREFNFPYSFQLEGFNRATNCSSPTLAAYRPSKADSTQGGPPGTGS